jgi:hypothetical protein
MCGKGPVTAFHAAVDPDVVILALDKGPISQLELRMKGGPDQMDVFAVDTGNHERLRRVSLRERQITIRLAVNSRGLVFQRWIRPRVRAFMTAIVRLLTSSFLKMFLMCESTV